MGEVVIIVCLIVCSMVVLIQALDVVRKKIGLQPHDAEAILAERFAKGEIEEAEYSDRLSSLRLGPPLQIK